MADLYWHERERLRREGSLGDLTEEPSYDLREGAWTLLAEYRRESVYLFDKTLTRLSMRFGERLARVASKQAGAEPKMKAWIHHSPVDPWLTTFEIVAEEGDGLLHLTSGGGNVVRIGPFPEELNDLFKAHRFNFMMTAEGEIQRVGSPALYEEIVRPALLARADPRLAEAENHYHEALGRYREGKARKAIPEAQQSIESALKAYGYAGAGLDKLAEDFRKRSRERGYVAKLMPHLEALIKDLNGMRGDLGAHAEKPGAPPVPDEYALLAIHLAGALIVFLSAREPALESMSSQ